MAVGAVYSMLVVRMVAALVQTINPVTAFFQIFERAVDVSDAHHRQTGEGSGGRSRHDVGQAGGAAFGNDDGRGSGGMRGANDGAQVMWILDAVEHHVQASGPARFIERGVFFRRPERDHALMRGAGGGAVQISRGSKRTGIPRSRHRSIIS